MNQTSFLSHVSHANNYHDDEQNRSEFSENYINPSEFSTVNEDSRPSEVGISSVTGKAWWFSDAAGITVPSCEVALLKYTHIHKHIRVHASALTLSLFLSLPPNPLCNCSYMEINNGWAFENDGFTIFLQPMDV